MKSLMSYTNEVRLECSDIIETINSITPILMLMCFLLGFFFFSKKSKLNDQMNEFRSKNKIQYSIENLKDEEHFFS
jgi:hypothetical protein